MGFCFWEKKNSPDVHVSIDFGTAYTGAAIGLHGLPDKTKLINVWPGDPDRTSLKAPSHSSSVYKGSSEGHEQYFWGYKYRDRNETEVLRALKLLLDDSQEIDYEPALNSKALLKGENSTAIKAVGDYLFQIVNHCDQCIRHEYGIAAVARPRHYWLTVPHECSDKFKNAMEKAAAEAGIDITKMNFVSDMDAAVFDCFCGPKAVKTKETEVVTVVDAGALQVRMGSWRMKTTSPASFEQVTDGNNGPCGSAMLDQNFENLLSKLFGSFSYFQLPQAARQAAMHYWQDVVKPNFGREQDKKKWFFQRAPSATYKIPMPGLEDDASIGLKKGFLLLDRAQVQGIFDLVIHQVKALLDSQIEAVAAADEEVKAIALVGGLGSSEYVLQKVKAAYPHIRVFQPPNAWSSVARGAILHGLSAKSGIKNTKKPQIAKRHYGIPYQTPFDPKLHREQDKYWCEIEEEYKAGNQVRWYIKKGDVLSENAPIKFPWYRTFTEGVKMSGSCSLYACDKDEAPTTITNNVYQWATTQYDFTSIPQEQLVKNTNSKGVKYYRVSYKGVLTPKQSKITYQHFFGKKCCGTVEVKY